LGTRQERFDALVSAAPTEDTAHERARECPFYRADCAALPREMVKRSPIKPTIYAAVDRQMLTTIGIKSTDEVVDGIETLNAVAVGKADVMILDSGSP